MRFTLALLTLVLGSSFAQARISQTEFARQCANLVTGEDTPGLQLKCRATTGTGASTLRAHGLRSSYSVDLTRSSRVKVSSWGLPGGLRSQKISYVIEAGVWGMGAKYLDLNCFETKNGQVRLAPRTAEASITVKTRVDDAQQVAMECVKN